MRKHASTSTRLLIRKTEQMQSSLQQSTTQSYPNSILLLLLLLLAPVLTAFGGVEESTAALQGSDISTTSVLTVIDNKYPVIVQGNSASLFGHGTIKNSVALQIEYAQNRVLAAQGLVVQFKIKPYDATGTPLPYLVDQGSITQELRVLYDPAAMVNEVDQHVYTFQGYFKFDVEITSVQDGNGNNINPDVLFRMEAAVKTERYYAFDHLWIPDVYNHVYLSADNALKVYWAYQAGAEHYELEWTHVNDYGFTAGTPLDKDEIPIDKNTFIYNSTRITTSNQYYEIPMVYDRGYIVYRIRAVSRGGAGYTENYYGRWSVFGSTYHNLEDLEDALSAGGALGRSIYAVPPHEDNKNWQITRSFAEDGKHKEVVSYFDGSLHNRQSVTLLNSTKSTLVGETIYGTDGSPMASVLPAPTGDAKLQYYENFNQNDDGDPYNASNLTLGATCVLTTDPMSVTSGASEYYGSKPQVGNSADYVPDAKGYPFTAIQYTPDPTGRVAVQSGAGDVLNMGAGKESHFFYSQPDQVELDRLFGSSVGYKSRYKKNMVVDANGQVSVTYVDPFGRTIATALAAGNPTTLDGILELDPNTRLPVLPVPPSVEALEQDNDLHSLRLDIDLLNKDNVGDLDDDDDENKSRASGALPPLKDQLHFYTQRVNPFYNDDQDYEYNLDATTYFDDDCLVGIDYQFVYDLKLNLLDACGFEQFDNPGLDDLFTGMSIPINPLNSYDLTDPLNINQPIIPYHDVITTPLSLGTYALSKTLTVNPEAAEYYAKRYIEDAACILPLSHFETEAAASMDPNGCNFTCTICVDDLIATIGDRPIMPGTDQENWDTLYEDCMDPCKGKDLCQIGYESMLADMYPGGQYCALPGSPGWTVSILNTASSGSNQLISNIRWLSIPPLKPLYKNADGTLATVEVVPLGGGLYEPAILVTAVVEFDAVTGIYTVTPDELTSESFVANFNTGWAESLVLAHPEYNYKTKFCDELVNVHVASGLLDTWEFDQVLSVVQTFAEANTVNLLDLPMFYHLQDYNVNINLYDNSQNAVDNLVNQDPFFSGVAVGSTPPNGVVLGSAQIQQFKNELNNYQGSGKTIFDYAANVRQCGGWYGAGPCAYQDFDVFIQTLSTADKDILWQNVMGAYASVKTKYRELVMQEIAITNECYNGCFGNNNFDPFDYDFFIQGFNNNGSEYFNYMQPCAMGNDATFGNSQPRFPAIYDMLDLTPVGLAIIQNQQQADYLLLLETGRCPLSFDLEILLKGLAGVNLFTTTSVPLVQYPSLFTYDLYSEITGFTPLDNPLTPFNPQEYSGTVTGATLNGTIEGFSLASPLTVVPNLDFTLTIPASATNVDWLTYPNSWNFAQMGDVIYTSNSGNTWAFTMLTLVDDDGDDQTLPIEVVLSGTTTLALNGCETEVLSYAGNGGSLDDCGPNSFAMELQALMNVMTDLGDLLSTNEVTVALELVNLVDYGLTFDGGEIMQVLGGDELRWQYDLNSSGAFTLKAFDAGTEIRRLTLYPSQSIGSVGNTDLWTGIVPQVNTAEFTVELSTVPISFTTSIDCYVSGSCAVNFGDCGVIEACADQADFIVILEAFVNNMVSTYGGTTQTNLQITLTDPALIAYNGNDDVITLHSTVGSQVGVAVFLGFVCPININIGIDPGFNNFTSAEFVIPSNAPNGDGNVSYQIQIHYTASSYMYSSDYDLCDIPSCPPCVPILVPPVDCQWAYTKYQAAFAGMPTGATVFVDEAAYCALGLEASNPAYLNYVATIKANAGIDVVYYMLSIEDFAFMNGAVYAGAYELLIAALGYPDNTDGMYISFNDFVSGMYSANCQEQYIGLVLKGYTTDNLADYCSVYAGDGPCFMMPVVAWPVIEADNPCEGFINDLIATNALDAYNTYIQELKDAFIERYVEQALATVVEELTVNRADQEYHYTLFYYDQSGNLVRTIPPQGVVKDNLQANLDTYRQDRADDVAWASRLHTTHKLATTYTYNTLGQLVKQHTPDGGISSFWYDKLGRIVASQNAQQKIDKDFSYVVFDALGRISEGGQLNSYTLPSDALLNAANFPDNWNTTREQVIRSHYDQTALTNPLSGEHNELRGRIAHTTYTNALDATQAFAYEFATHYLYDIHGNVSSLVQENALNTVAGQSFKRLDYEYDLISGNVNEVIFQEGWKDEFHHRYEYDDDNRITNVYTAESDVIWDQDAKYFYYAHGPLARTETGEHKVQGTDHAYTINGWLKGVNSSSLQADADMGRDGNTEAYLNSNDRWSARDAFGFDLGYFDGDYEAVTESHLLGTNNGKHFLIDISQNTTLAANNLYNGNIGHMSTAIEPLMNGGETPNTMVYRYDQLQRITRAEHLDARVEVNTMILGVIDDLFQTTYTYDHNGNLTTLTRKDDLGVLMDDFVYKYNNDGLGNPINQLNHVTDAVVGSVQTTDIETQANNNYTYDAIGQLLEDVAEGIKTITWTVTNKIKTVERTGAQINGSYPSDLEFFYDAIDNRVMKVEKPRDASGVKAQSEWITTYYVRDASGNVMSTYKLKPGQGASQYELQAQELYGSKRLGVKERNVDLAADAAACTTCPHIFTRTLAEKTYELSNHLGNVLATVSDRKLPTEYLSSSNVDYYSADVLSYSDYYPFGMQMPGRNASTGDYRYGFQGQETDDEVTGSESHVSYKYRMHDARLGRFLSLDPLAPQYAHNSPYAFSENRVIDAVELEGLESRIVINYIDNLGNLTAIRVISFRDVANEPLNIGLQNASTGFRPSNILVLDKQGGDYSNPQTFDKESELSANQQAVIANGTDLAGTGAGPANGAPVPSATITGGVSIGGFKQSNVSGSRSIQDGSFQSVAGTDINVSRFFADEGYNVESIMGKADPTDYNNRIQELADITNSGAEFNQLNISNGYGRAGTETLMQDLIDAGANSDNIQRNQAASTSPASLGQSDTNIYVGRQNAETAPGPSTTQFVVQ
jgi:RHS repeat-associated protein